MNNQLQIELKEDIAQGIYANLAVITHSSSEFIVDFVRVMPGMPKAGVKSRIVLAPEHAKRLLRALEEIHFSCLPQHTQYPLPSEHQNRSLLTLQVLLLSIICPPSFHLLSYLKQLQPVLYSYLMYQQAQHHLPVLKEILLCAYLHSLFFQYLP